MDKQLLTGHYRVYLAAGTQIVAQQGRAELQFYLYLGEQSWLQRVCLSDGEMYLLEEAGWVSLSGSALLLSAPCRTVWQRLGGLRLGARPRRLMEKSGC